MRHRPHPGRCAVNDPCPACTAALDQMHAEIEARARAAHARRDAELESFIASQRLDGVSETPPEPPC